MEHQATTRTTNLSGRRAAPFYVATCPCGWRSPAWSVPEYAEDDAQDHNTNPDRPPAWLFYDPEITRRP